MSVAAEIVLRLGMLTDMDADAIESVLSAARAVFPKVVLDSERGACDAVCRSSRFSPETTLIVVDLLRGVFRTEIVAESFGPRGGVQLESNYKTREQLEPLLSRLVSSTPQFEAPALPAPEPSTVVPFTLVVAGASAGVLGAVLAAHSASARQELGTGLFEGIDELSGARSRWQVPVSVSILMIGLSVLSVGAGVVLANDP